MFIVLCTTQLNKNYRLSQYYYLYLPVADAGFIEGGPCNSIARKAHAKILGPRPLLPKTTPIFDRFLREASCPICQSLHFQSRSLLRHAEVSHRSWFLSSLPKQGGFQLACHSPAQRGVPWNPRNPPP